jgi:acyl-CoA thioesterase FadM
MTVTTDDQVTSMSGRPRYEGANIRTWIGFKHFMYLVEEAVLQWFRDRGIGPGRLYHKHGVGLEIVDASALLPAVLEVDDQVVAEVIALGPGRFSVTLGVEREGSPVVVLKGKVTVALVREREAPGAEPMPGNLVSLVVPEVAAATTLPDPRHLRVTPGEDVRSLLAPPGSRAFLWSWRARYFHCHYSDRIQHSGYVRALEEVVDRFLADRGISVGRMLHERGWIPVVSRVRVQLVADAHMEETIHTSFVVEDVLKGITYDARMDCHVQRGDRLVHTATARILHGYAIGRGEGAGRLAELDDSTLAALTREVRA